MRFTVQDNSVPRIHENEKSDRIRDPVEMLDQIVAHGGADRLEDASLLTLVRGSKIE